MNKFFLVGAAAFGLALAAVGPADAWINHKFSVGANWHWQSGGNNLLWGLFRNSQPPGPDGYQHGPGPGGGFPGFGPHYGPNEFQYFGNQQTPTPNPAAAAAQTQAYYGYPQNPYQPVSYAPGYSYTPYNYAPYYYNAGYNASMYQPGYYGYYQPPNYWYDR